MVDSGKIPTTTKGMSFREHLIRIKEDHGWIRYKNHYGSISRGWIEEVGKDSVVIRNPFEKVIIQIDKLVSIQRPETLTGVERQAKLKWEVYRKKS